MEAFHLPLLFGFGVLIGLLGSVLGIGGGIFTVPFLALVLGLPMRQAVAASLAVIVAVSCVMGAANLRRGFANFRLAAALSLTTGLGSLAGALGNGLLAPETLKLFFALVLLPAAAAMLPRAGGESRCQAPAGTRLFAAEYFDPALKARVAYSVRRVKRASVVSFFAGSLSGLLGIGGGVVQVPLMSLCCGVPMKAAAATSNILIGVSAAPSVVVYLRRGLLPGGVTAVLAAGAVLGALLGLRALRRLPQERLRTAFAALALLVAARMLFEAL